MKFYTIPILQDFEISKSGVIRNKKTLRIKSQYIGSTGYYMISVSKNNKSRPYRVHRLKAITFKPNPNNLPEVNHDDGNKLNNRNSNLLWTDHLGNMRHAFRTGLANNTGEKNGMSKITAKIAKQIKDRLPNESQQSIADTLGISRSLVQGISNGRLWKHV